MAEKIKMKLLKHFQYGRERYYPGCPLSEAICLAMKNKCMNEDTITCLVQVGKINVEYESIKERPKA